MEFNEKLQALRKQKNLTQEELAEKLLCQELPFPSGNREEDIPELIPLKK